MIDFHRTSMGQRFFEATMPSLVRELARLNKNLERFLDLAEKAPAEPPVPAPAPEEP